MAACAAIAFFSWGDFRDGAAAHDTQNEPLKATQSRPQAKRSTVDMTQARVIVNPGGVQFTPPEPGTYVLARIGRGVDGDVVDVLGQKRKLFDILGDKVGLISFIYTQCGDETGCPMAISSFYEVEDLINADPSLKSSIKMVTLSFDPINDTPDVMADFANVHADDSVDHSLHFHTLEAKFGTEQATQMVALLGPESICRGAAKQTDGSWSVQKGTVDQTWTFLTTASEADLNPILDGYGQYIVKDIDEEGHQIGSFSHVLKVYLVDRNHKVRNIYSTSFLYPELVVNDLKTLLLEQRMSAAK
ncbi:hypothetical protein BEN30_09580 [Magnetovibrio blakemorei]|uniref:Thioredoxin domain-containing protein n=2 Tax=Magnetovibrio blakemorei TaxID=28181 RepID=A0A1E5Q801_9PROT|nr:hypothetical protein BEN30_09580 [Magnetovibrio blakemorei]